MSQEQPNNLLHGITLKTIVEELVERHGFETLGEKIPIACFTKNPSIKSSLKFLRRTPWARGKVERLYVKELKRKRRNAQRKAQRKARDAANAALAAAESQGEGDLPTPTRTSGATNAPQMGPARLPSGE